MVTRALGTGAWPTKPIISGISLIHEKGSAQQDKTWLFAMNDLIGDKDYYSVGFSNCGRFLNGCSMTLPRPRCLPEKPSTFWFFLRAMAVYCILNSLGSMLVSTVEPPPYMPADWHLADMATAVILAAFFLAGASLCMTSGAAFSLRGGSPRGTGGPRGGAWFAAASASLLLAAALSTAAVCFFDDPVSLDVAMNPFRMGLFAIPVAVAILFFRLAGSESRRDGLDGQNAPKHRSRRFFFALGYLFLLAALYTIITQTL